MDLLNLIAGFFYIFVFSVVFISLVRRNLFFCVFVFIEYFYLLGLGVYPVLLALGLVEFPQYAGAVGLSVLSPVHIIFYSIGSLIGFFVVKNKQSSVASVVIAKLNIDPNKAFLLIFLICISFYFLYVSNLGFRQALVGASFARSGNFDFFDDGNAFAYLTRPMMVGLLGASFAYYYVFVKKAPFLYLLASLIMGVVIYSVTVSRFALLNLVFLPLVYYLLFMFGGGGFSKALGLLLTILFGILAFAVLGFGKAFVFQIASFYFDGEMIDLELDAGQASSFDAFSHLYFSINAGVNSFFLNGLVVYRDVLLSPFGVVPSSVFVGLGLGDFSYQLVSPEHSFSCYNTFMISGVSGECYLPPYYPGASAYFLPLIGGFLFGFFRFYLYGLVCRVWSSLCSMGRSKDIPVLLVFFFFAEQIMLFIPATISLTGFMVISSVFIYKMRVIK